MKVRIYYHHTDSGGVVYYANYLEFLEEARTEFFEAKGLFIKELIDKGILFVVARQEIDYKAPAFYADTLEVTSWVNDASNVRLNFEGVVKNQTGKVIAQAKTVLVCVDSNLKPQAIPEDVKAKLEIE